LGEIAIKVIAYPVYLRYHLWRIGEGAPFALRGGVAARGCDISPLQELRNVCWQDAALLLACS
jgi:hypothetical protein